ncbi:MAG: 50S ribosomal protein L10 [Bdellovibrionota bacterium]
MDKAKKGQEIADISEKFSRAKAAFLVDFKGMNVEQVTNLRKKLYATKSEMRVVRNTLAKRALKDYPAQATALNEGFTGTNAIVFAYGDASASAKSLSEFGKDVETLDIKLGVMDGQALDRDMIKYLATLPPLEVLRAQFLGTLAAPMQKFVSTLAAPGTQFVSLLKAYENKQANG